MRRRRDYPAITWSESKSQYRATVPIGGKRRDVYGKTEDEVMDKIDQLDADTAQGVDRSMTLAEYSARWGKVKAAGLKPKSRDVYKNALKNHILPRLGGLPLCEIKPMHVDEMLAALDGKSASLQSKALRTLKQIMASALENDLIPKNPCAGKKAGGTKAKIKTPLTREQQDSLCRAIAGKRVEPFVLLCLYAGLRGEEAKGLLWRNVHLGEVPYIDVRHVVTYDSAGNPTHSDVLKTSAARRSIPIPPKLADALKARRPEPFDIGDSFVIPSVATGKEMSLSAFRRMWAQVQVDFPVTPHQLRHTYISELCASGMDIKKIQYLAGHATVQMTLNVYTHVTQNRPEQLAPAIIKAFAAGNSAGNPESDAPKSVSREG